MTTKTKFTDSATLLHLFLITNSGLDKSGQVNKWPDLSHLFTFRINFYSQEFFAVREAGNKLMGEGLISETDTGQFFLTLKGFQYCKEHYREFPPEQWWPEEQINQENLRRVLQPA